MIIKKLAENEYKWRTIFKYRTSMNDFIIERKSRIHPENNHEVYLNYKDAKEFVKFFKEVKQ